MAAHNEQHVLDTDQSRFTIHLRNSTNADNVHAYVTGTDIQRGHLFLLRADGKTPYYPANPSSNGSPLAHDCAIKLGAPGSTTSATIPHLENARIYFVIGKLVFALNQGEGAPALVEPSPFDLNSKNHDAKWSFAEFTWNAENMYANISFQDFVGLPIALTLKSGDKTQHVAGLPAGGVSDVCKKLEHVGNDHSDWAKLVMKSQNGDYLRAITPYNGMKLYPGLFKGYYDKYVDKVWQKYQNQTLLVNTAAPGKLKGHVENGVLKVGGESFKKPSTADIFGNNSGPFANEGSDERKAIVPLLCAGFVRSTLLSDHETPDPDGRQDYYKDKVTDHYAKIVHEVLPDGRGYAFAYDDVKPKGAKDQSGRVKSQNPDTLIVAVGGH
ncbi:Nn.00g106870.m01.CDS01 [Neocucurbitaria sp. VM-36]